jgi:lipopolysaccharide export system protein LptC
MKPATLIDRLRAVFPADESGLRFPGLRRNGGPRRERDRYSRFVGLAKFVFPGIACMLLLTAVFWPNFSGTKQHIERTIKDSFSASAFRNFEMLSPTYFSTDERNRPYQLNAKSARQLNRNSDAINLVAPKARIRLEKGNWVAVSARNGKYSQKKQLLTLTGNVYLLHDANYTFRTEQATVNLKDKSAWGNKPVFAKGPKGSVEAEGFRVVDKGQTVIFTGKSKVVLKLDKQDVKDLSGPRKVGQ